MEIEKIDLTDSRAEDWLLGMLQGYRITVRHQTSVDSLSEMELMVVYNRGERFWVDLSDGDVFYDAELLDVPEGCTATAWESPFSI